jgi:hypothetical protein
MKEGTKYDNGKLRLAEMIIDFRVAMEELCKVWEFGANKYEKSNWKKLANPIDRYTNAMLRHLLAEETNLVDDESNLLHAAHIAFNALARLHFIVRNKGVDTKLKHFYELKEGQVVTQEDIHNFVKSVYLSPPLESPDEIDVRPGTITPMEWSEGGKNG